MDHSDHAVRIDPRTTIRALVLAVAAVVTAHLILVLGFWHGLGRDHVLGLVRRFDMNLEANVPTYLSTMLLAVAATLLALIAVPLRRDKGKFGPQWMILAAVFLLLSMDEAAQLHDLLSPVTARVLGPYGLNYFNWVIPATAFAAILGVALIPFLRHLPARTRNRFILAGILYVGGAAGMEVVGGLWIEHASTEGERGVTFHLILAAEETLEYAGLLVFIHALLDYLSTRPGAITLEFGVSGVSPPP